MKKQTPIYTLLKYDEEYKRRNETRNQKKISSANYC